ncbi:periplasmic divalent cation tolerance protein [Desulfobaculum xiamenense]|uniref:Periplasmic divalent cation tolerance protein n=1 Tax=Desulfobaculum xiamenense TaxID=995050 RepID=A0A846QF29_9BACT|nr:divalent-cation tolerance protein CutA [Desulfobaculum xiamenense]NJB67376.1 periplasmic divalent cation tolerance protein [Desulfobaculum xiamenense]
MDAILVYITASNAEEAERIGRMLVSRRLAACVNIGQGIRSLYWWDGAVQSDSETAFIAKTVRGRFAELAQAVREVHSYETPCIVALPVVDGDPDFLDWLRDNARPG